MSHLRYLDLPGPEPAQALGTWQRRLAACPACQGVAVGDLGHATGPAIVKFPAEFDLSNAGDVAEQLRAAIAPGISALVADLTTTAFCDSSGLRIVILARDWAEADNVELRLAVPPGPTLTVLKLVGLDELLPIYPSLGQALTGRAAPDGDAPHE